MGLSRYTPLSPFAPGVCAAPRRLKKGLSLFERSPMTKPSAELFGNEDISGSFASGRGARGRGAKGKLETIPSADWAVLARTLRLAMQNGRQPGSSIRETLLAKGRRSLSRSLKMAPLCMYIYTLTAL